MPRMCGLQNRFVVFDSARLRPGKSFDEGEPLFRPLAAHNIPGYADNLKARCSFADVYFTYEQCCRADIYSLHFESPRSLVYNPGVKTFCTLMQQIGSSLQVLFMLQS